MLLAFAAGAAQAEEFKLRLDVIPYALHAPFHHANLQGWYKQRGLDMTIEDGNGSVNTILMVSAGSYDVGFANLATMATGRSKGAKVIGVAGIIHRNDMALFVDRKLGVKNPQDLIAKNVQVIYLTGGFMSPYVGTFFKKAGGDPAKLNSVGVAGGLAYVTQYLAGAGGALLTTAPYVEPLVNQTRPSDVFMFSDYGVDMPAFGIVASEEAVRTKADAVRRFLAVTSRAWKQAWDGGGVEMVDAMAKQRPQVKINPQIELARLAAYRRLAAVDETKGKSVLWQSPETWDKFFRVMIESNVLPPDAKPADYFTNAYLPAE
jgi:NitT/TauT family transport system substrate-binding protein